MAIRKINADRDRAAGELKGGPADRDPRRSVFGASGFASALVAMAVVVGVAFSPAATRHAQAAGGPPDSTVAAWGEALERAFGSAGRTPAEGNTYTGLLHYAIYDAVVTVKGGYEPLFYKAPRQPNASAEAAVAAAGRTVLVSMLPGQSAIFEETYAAALKDIPDGAAKAAGIKVGEGAAQASLALPIAKQAIPGKPYAAPNPPVPGVYEPTAPTPVIGLWMLEATPVFLGSRAQFRPAGTPSLSSDTYARDFNEVKEIGSKTSTTRTQAQTDQALFWSEPPVQQALRSMRGFVKERNMDIVDAARFMAIAGGVYQEGLLACFEAKYAMPAWRPITAIRRADTDGNDATVKDEAWEPLIGTPNHPEYPSGHSCVTPGIGSVAERFMGGAPFSYTMVSVAGRPNRTFSSAAELAKDVGDARIYGGIHFRQAIIDGSLISRQIADLLLNNYFKPTQGGSAPSAPLPPDTGTNAPARPSDASAASLAAGATLVAASTVLVIVRRRRSSRA